MLLHFASVSRDVQVHSYSRCSHLMLAAGIALPYCQPLLTSGATRSPWGILNRRCLSQSGGHKVIVI